MPKPKTAKTVEEEDEDWVKRAAEEHVKSGGNEGVRFLRKGKDDPLIKAANEAFAASRQRKLN